MSDRVLDHDPSYSPRLADYLRAEMFQGRSPRFFWFKATMIIAFRMDGRACVGLFRIARALHLAGWRRTAKGIEHYVIRRFGCTLHPNTIIGMGLRLPHPTGIVIGNEVVIGQRCSIYQQVTLGGVNRGDWRSDDFFPSVGDDCILWSGCRVVGPVHIGDRVMVGANAVVTKDVPSDHVAVGVPARARPAKGKAESMAAAEAGV